MHLRGESYDDVCCIYADCYRGTNASYDGCADIRYDRCHDCDDDDDAADGDEHDGYDGDDDYDYDRDYA